MGVELGSPNRSKSGWLARVRNLLHAATSQPADVGPEERLLALARANTELGAAYDATLEAWARAIDLRDKAGEGHAQRVADLTVRLGRTMRLDEHNLAHLRRGALLHDIGKIGVPEAILQKPGALTDSEWEVMKDHPVYAHDLLSPVEYLRAALDVPYCHHEKWDGTGYPRQLRGAAIPLFARIFAVVDVWDAMRSDRPYRPAMDADFVRDYVREQAYVHFDPKVAEAFLSLEPHPCLTVVID